MKTPEGPTWLPIGEGLRQWGCPAVAFSTDGAVLPGNAALPLRIAPEHRDLPHWTAANDPR